MIENILILDTETTGFDPSKGATVIEIGAILFNLKHKQALQVFSTLLPCNENPVQDINHIDPLWTQLKYNKQMAINFLEVMGYHADCIVAHNAQFDKKFINTLCINSDFLDIKWICTKSDFKWGVQLYRNRLQDICEAMKVPYINAHRALADCQLLVECFKNVIDLEGRMHRAFQGGNNSSYDRR